MQRITRSGVTTILVVLVVAAVAHAEQKKTDQAKKKAKLIALKQRFGEQQFSPAGGFVIRLGQKLPKLKWENPQLIAQAVKKTDIPVRWFDDRMVEVKTASKPGRYYAYGEAPTPDGPRLRRAMTCCCLQKNVELSGVAKRWIKLAKKKSSDEPSSKSVASIVSRWRTTEAGAVELAAFLEGNQKRLPPRRGQWQMDNATQHVRLKRKLMGLERTPVVRPVIKPLTGKPAPVLRNAPLQQARVSKKQFQAMQSQLDAWYAASREPMAVVIARNGVIVFSKGYGMVDGRQVTVDTPMSLDSAMKPLIGLQLATYVDRGYLKLDEPIGKYLPDFNTPRDRKLTFRAAHVHATGIHFPWSLAFKRLFYFHTWHESLIAHCRREWAPGAKYRYGVVGVILSVRAFELLRGRNYWDAMERDLFTPLGIRNILPGGRGFSAESLARLGVLLGNRGKYGTKQFFSEKTYHAILPTSLKPYFPMLNMTYGIGLQDQSRSFGPGSYGHGGGCGTLLAVNPKSRLVFAMVRNRPGKDYRKQRAQVLATLKAMTFTD